MKKGLKTIGKIDRGRARFRRRVLALLRRTDAESAYELLRAKRGGDFRALGFSSIERYASFAFGIGASKARALISLATRLESLPQVRSAFREGQLAWTKARLIARVADVKTQRVWISAARVLPRRLLEQEIAIYKGRLPRVRIRVGRVRVEKRRGTRRLRRPRRFTWNSRPLHFPFPLL